jgi:peptidoglycan/xylan/chitin deacetylase (PgdA/CDA1 family)
LKSKSGFGIIIICTIFAVMLSSTPIYASSQIITYSGHSLSWMSSLSPSPVTSSTSPPSLPSASYKDNVIADNTDKNDNGNKKLAIINFDDGWENQYTIAKPILDKYGFKATFFVVCNYVGGRDRMSWQDIETLHNEGFDIESHSMNHNIHDPASVSDDTFNFEIGQSKQCLADHGIDATVYGYPFNKGFNIPRIVDIVSKYYNLARTGVQPLTFLHCDGYPNYPQTDCRTYDDSGNLNFANRYSIRSWSHHIVLDNNNSINNDETFNAFIQEVNSQNNYNKDGKINAIPIVTYHELTMDSHTPQINAELFDAEMKYLYDNGFRVLTMADFGYDENSNSLYIKK